MVRILVSSRRPCDSDALATSSYGTNFAQPLSAATLVRAAVRVVLPWSMWPMVPTLTCGLDRSNFSLAMSFVLPSLYPLASTAVTHVSEPALAQPSRSALLWASFADLRSLAHHPKLAKRAKGGADDQD